jgi:3-isopropylmalate/(R)-2-methylmalate dehydratase small subunit
MGCEPFSGVAGRAAPLPDADIDTDIIFPARFLLITARQGLGVYAFHDRRHAGDGSECPDFILNQPLWRDAPILVAGPNFGCGSSREQAVWALQDAGIRAIIAPGFGEIFHANCLRNGLLPIVLRPELMTQAMLAAENGAQFAIGLEEQAISIDQAHFAQFALPPERKQMLAKGWDETDQIINQHGDDISAFEARQEQIQPWLYAASAGD